MKAKNWIYPFTVIGMFSLLISGCSKSDNNNNNNKNPASQIPVVTTEEIANVTQTTAVCGGNVTSQGSDSVVVRGVCWGTSINPTILFPHSTDGRGNGIFTSNLTALNPNTPYYVRAYATNSAGTGYGDQVSFTTQWTTGGTVTDIEGNVYHTITIGTKRASGTHVWMAENLKTTKYNDTTSIPLVTDESLWDGLITPAYCWYHNDAPSYKNIYGALYNYYAVITGKLCPKGWHVPSDSEWISLANYLGGDSLAGGKMKSTGTIESGTGLWYAPNASASNESGFTAIPGGRRDSGDFLEIGYHTHFWSSTECGYTAAWSTDLDYNFNVVRRSNFSITAGLPVRCMKNN